MAFGMSWDEYWYGDVRMTGAFLKAKKEANKLKRQQFNAEAHLLGMYFYEALCDASPLFRAFSKSTKAIPYRTEPYNLFPDEPKTESQREEQEKREEQFARAYMMQMDMVGRNWGKQ